MKTLILFLDAIRFDDLNKENTPFLYALSQKGAFGRLDTLFGYHVEYSIFTGSYPTKHNVWTWLHYDKKKSSFRWIKPFLFLFIPLDRTFLSRYLRIFISAVTCFFRYLKGQTRILPINKIPLKEAVKFDFTIDKNYVDFNPLPIPTLFDILRQKNISFWAFEWPIFGNRKKVSFKLFGNNDRDKLRFVKKEVKKRDLVYCHVWQLDSITHKFGVGSPEVKKHLRFLDSQVKEIIEENGGLDNFNLVIFSDHGMASIKGKVDIMPILKPYLSRIEILPDSTMVRIWLKDQSIKDNLGHDLELLDGGRVYTKKNVGELKINYDRKYMGDLLFAVDVGLQISPNFFQDNEMARAMHGYVGHSPDLDGILIVNSPKIKLKRIKEANLVDLMPTILDLLNIETELNFDGESKI